MFLLIFFLFVCSCIIVTTARPAVVQQAEFHSASGNDIATPCRVNTRTGECFTQNGDRFVIVDDTAAADSTEYVVFADGSQASVYQEDPLDDEE